MSSVCVYGRRVGSVLDEQAPMVEIGDPYGDTKIEAEQCVRELQAAGSLDLTVLRPTVIYGSGDRLFMPKLVENLRGGGACIIGRGDNTVDLVHVRDVAAFLVTVLETPETIGRTFNLNNLSNPTWSEFLTLVARELGLPPPTRRLPYGLAFVVAGAMELVAQLTGKPPKLTRYGVRVIGRQYDYPLAQARALGFTQSVSLEDGVRAWAALALAS